MTNVFADNHHTSLTTSLVRLFEGRLGYKIFRPIGLEWFTEGYWAINNLVDTARQYLDPECAVIADGTPPLNVATGEPTDGIYTIVEPGGLTFHKAITLEAFKSMRFDFVIASILEHIPLFTDLIARFQPQAKLIVQVGNNWPAHYLVHHNVMASIKSGAYPNSNAIYYHQDFDTNIFKPSGVAPVLHRISSYVNVLGEREVGRADFARLEATLGVPMKSFGGQCRDGVHDGATQLAASMQQDSMILHVKDYGDGYGHIVHNAMAVGVPLIVRGKFIKGTLADEIIDEYNSIDLDELGEVEADVLILSVLHEPSRLKAMSDAAVKAFRENVDFVGDAERIRLWLETL